MHDRSLFSFVVTLACPGVVTFLLLGCPGGDPLPLGDSSTGVEPTTTAETPVCVSGEQVSCPCEQGPDGVQTCLPGGDGFGSCMCDPTPLDDTSTTGPAETETGTTDPSTTSTTDPSTTSTDSTSSDSGDSTTTTGEPAVCDEYMSPPGLECDVWLQNCAAGEKCMPWSDDGSGSWNSWRCSPLDPAPDQFGEDCMVEGSGTSGIDSCDLGLMCWNVDAETNMGVCTELCDGCPDDASCETAGQVCTITNDDFLTICLPGCDPLAQDCPAGQACYPVNESFLCAPDASGVNGQYGDGCAFINACDPGLACLAEASLPGGCGGAPGCCTEFCDLSDPTGDAQCMGDAGGQMCTAWYGMGMAPPGYEDVGVCSL